MYCNFILQQCGGVNIPLEIMMNDGMLTDFFIKTNLKILFIMFIDG